MLYGLCYRYGVGANSAVWLVSMGMVTGFAGKWSLVYLPTVCHSPNSLGSMPPCPYYSLCASPRCLVQPDTLTVSTAGNVLLAWPAVCMACSCQVMQCFLPVLFVADGY